MPTLHDWILLGIVLVVMLRVYYQDKDIARMEKILRLQNSINESLNKKVEDLRMGRNFVPAQPGIDDGFLYDPTVKRREHG